MRRLLMVHHSRTGGADRLARAVIDGTGDVITDNVEIVTRPALEATAADVLAADALILGTPENFGYMSGALKHFFDTVYYDVLDHTRGRPYALFVKASTDGQGAVRAVERIVTGLGWRAVHPPVVVVGDITDDALAECRELGALLVAGLDAGMW